MDYFPRVVIEGRVFESVLEAEANLTERFIWDRLDIYGRKVFGQVPYGNSFLAKDTERYTRRVEGKNPEPSPSMLVHKFSFYLQVSFPTTGAND